MDHDPGKTEIPAPIMALDLGKKRVGAAVTDALRISITRVAPIKRSSWKILLAEVSTLIRRFDAQTLVIGLPLSMDGSLSAAASEAERTAGNFAKSLKIPVFLQDERLTSSEAESNLRAEGRTPAEIAALVDSEAAAIILRDFLNKDQRRFPVIIQ